MEEYKYADFSELMAAIQSGELVIPEDEGIIIGNDVTSLYIPCGEVNKHGNPLYEKVFEGGVPQNMLVDVLKYLGIPTQPA